MKVIGFIGAYDKTDMMLNVAKIITTLGKRVLMIDSTLNQKARYVVPVINPTTSYITNFEDIDVAVGFENLKQISQYLGSSEKELPYDILFVDTDTQERVEEFKLIEAQTNFFVTSFDIYSLKKGLEILSGIKENMSLTKVLFCQEILKEDDDYLNFLSLTSKIIWNEYRVYFPLENGDLSVIAENQRVAKVKFKRLSAQYKDGVLSIAQMIFPEISETDLRRAMKTIERGV